MQRNIFLPKISLLRLRKYVFVLLALVLVFAGGYTLGREGYKAQFINISEVQISRQIPPGKENIDFGLFWRVWDTLGAEYFDKTKLNASNMVYGAIQGMVASIGDPYTVFLSPSENKVVQEDLQGHFDGVGIQIGFKGTQLAVIAPLPESPAEKAGIKAGDYIIGIKDEQKGIDRGTQGITLPEAVEAIRGPKGSTITLALLRDGSDSPLIIDVVRDSINVPSVIFALEGEGEDIAHIKLLKFVEETNGEWEKAVREILKNPNIKGIVLDLRNNPGGFLHGSVDIAGEFVKRGTLIVSEEPASGNKNRFETDRHPRLADYPLVILVNEGSASASEILAGALREQADITIIGETTFGKGTIQEPRQLEDGVGLHITTAKWLTPKGNWVNEEGIEPDVTVEDDPETTEDEQLIEAIRVLKEE